MQIARLIFILSQTAFLAAGTAKNKVLGKMFAPFIQTYFTRQTTPQDEPKTQVIRNEEKV